MPNNDLISQGFNVSDEEIRGVENRDHVRVLAVKLFTRSIFFVEHLRDLHCSSNDGSPKEFTRNDAIIAALFLRFNRHLANFHQQILQDNLEVASLLARTSIDTGITLCYLVDKNNPVYIERYLIHSLKRPKQYLDSLRFAGANGAVLLPNAHIIIRDIQRSFDESGIAEQEVTKERWKEWENGGIRGRAVSLQWEDLYTRMFTLTSDAVHGSWENLRTFHLESRGGGFFSMRGEPTKWTYEILVGMCEFITRAAGILVSLLPDHHSERLTLTEEFNNTFGRMKDLYHKDQENIARLLANTIDPAGWQNC